MKFTIAIIAALTATTATAQEWLPFSAPGEWPQIRFAIRWW